MAEHERCRHTRVNMKLRRCYDCDRSADGVLVDLRARVKELEDTIILYACSAAIDRSFGRNTYASTVSEEIRSRRDEEWNGADVEGLERI